METPRDLKRLAAACREVAAGEEDILALYLFGSHARGDARPGSDVDLGVLPRGRRRMSLDRLIALESRFEQRLGRPVDLVDAGACAAFLALDIIRGERVYCADETLCDEFDLFVLRRAADLAPFERQRRSLLLGHAA